MIAHRIASVAFRRKFDTVIPREPGILLLFWSTRKQIPDLTHSVGPSGMTKLFVGHDASTDR